MKILLVTSGGDAPGINRFIYEFQRRFKGQVYFAYAGFGGLVDNKIYPIENVMVKSLRNCAGAVVRSSRCPEFKQARYFKIGLENARNFDCVIILGGNGSEKGAKRLFENGVNTIFVPVTIDNDVEDCAYSIGFFSAVNAGVKTVENSMPSIITMNSACVYEVMGRKCDAIAKAVAEAVRADFCVGNEKELNLEKILNVIKSNHEKAVGTCGIIRENIVNIDDLAKELNEQLGDNIVKTQIVGRIQRGCTPTKQELDLATRYAKGVAKCIKQKLFGKRVLANENLEIVANDFK